MARPPRVAVTDAPRGPVSGDHAIVHVRASGSARVVRAFVEGREVASRALPEGGDAALDVRLLPGKNHVAVVAFDAAGFASAEAAVEVTSARDAGKRPDVWVVAVGVGRYPHLDDDEQLPAAPHDAHDLGAALAALAGDGRRYARAHVRELEDDAVTRESVRAAIAELSQMSEGDLAVVLFAGHGAKPTASEDMVFVLPTVGASGRVTADDVRANGVSWRDVGAELERARGRVFVLLDACHSGHMTRDGGARTEEMAATLAREGRSGLLVFAAAKGREESKEPGTSRALVLDDRTKRSIAFDERAPHGFFTGALLRALADSATDRDGDGAIETGELVDEVSGRVAVATNMEQTPWVVRREYFGDFDVADVRCPIGTAPVAGRGCAPVDDVRCPGGMASLPAGDFDAGQGARRTVGPFCLDRTEVTVAAYDACVKSGGCTAPRATTKEHATCNEGAAGRADHPINCVDAAQAAAFCAARGARLPSDDEWGYVVRGGAENRPFPWGDEKPERQLCWMLATRVEGTCPVGAFPNGDGVAGIHDLRREGLRVDDVERRARVRRARRLVDADRRRFPFGRPPDRARPLRRRRRVPAARGRPSSR